MHSALCRTRVVGGVVLVDEGKQDTATPAIDRRLGRLLSLYAWSDLERPRSCGLLLGAERAVRSRGPRGRRWRS